MPEVNLAGARLGDYTLLRQLGRGAMAEVYLAQHHALNRQVAIKLLKPHLARDATYLRRFEREAQAAASLVHPNIVQVYDVGCQNGWRFIVQEYVSGLNLREFITRRGIPSPSMGAAILRQVAAALGKAAEHRLVHRDIKPDNIMLGRDGTVKVADFGLARPADGSVGLTNYGVALGTPLYMSPEQIEGKPLDPRSDLYSLGVTSYYMLSGRHPFEGKTSLSVAMQHLQTPPPRLELLRPELPASLGRVVHRLLEKQPDRRYPSARDLLADLRSIEFGECDENWREAFDFELTLSAAEDSAQSAATQQLQTVLDLSRQTKSPRWHVAGLWAAAIFLAAFAGGAVALLRRAPFVLARIEAANVTRLADASAQLDMAQSLMSEPWLLSVEEHFPEATPEIRDARQDLARLYLEGERWEDALKIFDKCANSIEPNDQAFAFAGRSFLFARRRQWDDAAKALENLAEVINKGARLEPDFRQLAAGAHQYVRREVGAKHDNAWDALVESLEPDEDSDPAGE